MQLLLVSLVLISGSTTSLAMAKEFEPNELQLKTEKVIIFKDGYFLIVKKGKAKVAEDGTFFTTEVPDAAVLGTFWAIPTKGKLKSMTAALVETEKETKKMVDCSTTVEIISANVGSKCSLVVDNDKRLTGTITKILGKQFDQGVSPVDRSTFALSATATASVSQFSGSQFILNTADGDMLINASSVKQLTIPNMKSKIEKRVVEKKKEKRLTFRCEEKGQEKEVLIMYFRPGVRWIPTYRVDLAKAGDVDGQKQALLSLQAELLNEAEDLVDVPIDIVVGVPNFRFRTTPSPLILERTLRNALVQAAPQLMGNPRQMMGNQMFSNSFTQRSSEYRANTAATVDVAIPTELETNSGHDLFVYSLPKMTLKKGERATVPILETKVPYRNVYTWEINVKHNESIMRKNDRTESPLEFSKNDVWRQIELINNSKMPWTTGAAMIVDGFQPLAQEMITYTPSGNSCRVPVTVSVDLRGRVEDTETGRQLNALTFSRSPYAKLSGKLSIDFLNNKPEPIDLEVKIRFGGMADKISDDGKKIVSAFRQSDWQNYTGNAAVNSSTEVTWTQKVKAREKFQPTVEYHFYSDNRTLSDRRRISIV